MFSALQQWRSFVVTQKQDDSDVNFVVRMYKRFQSIDALFVAKMKSDTIKILKEHS